MPKKKHNAPKYFVYYEKKTGKILSVTNEQNLDYEYGIEATFDDVEKFLTGEWLFRDFSIGYKRIGDNAVLAVMPNVDQDYAFRNNVYEWIKESKKSTNVIVEWNGPKKHWAIYFNPEFKSSYNDNIITSKLVFFVTLETDFDFLIRTIYVNTSDLFEQELVAVPFQSTFEKSIDKISIGSKLVFKTYGLKVIHE